MDFDFHKVSQIELCERFNTNTKTGVTASQASKGLEKHGPNSLTPPPTTPQWIKFLGCLFSKSASLFWLAAAFCFIAYMFGFDVANYYLGVVISGLIIVDRCCSFYQKIKSEIILENLKEVVPQRALCLRDAEWQTINASELTLGDIVEIKKGDVVPADIRILESYGCKVVNVNLTGESEPQLRSPKLTDENPLETKNLAFMSTTVEAGSAVGMVVQIGDQTVWGRVANLGTVLYSGQSPINKKIETFIFNISAIIFSVGMILTIIAYMFGHNWLFVVIFVIGLIPAGFHAKMNENINQAFENLASKKCFVKNLEALETLGNLSCICTNKTGVITQAEMTLSHMWYDNKIVSFDNISESFEEHKNLASWKPLERAAILCNTARFKDGQNDIPIVRKEVFGNQTDAAILKCTELGNITEYRENNKKVYEVPFNSTNRYQISVYETEETTGKRHLLVMKGAPENIIERCNTIFLDGKEQPLTQDKKNNIELAIKELAGLGERVIGFCDLILTEDKYPIGCTFNTEAKDFDQGFRFIGLMSMINPTRADVPDAVRGLHYNVKVIMVTGDHPVTAKAIALSAGILSEGNETINDISERWKIPVKDINPRDARVILGEELKHMTDEELIENLIEHSEIVFARTSPFQKLAIVEALQSTGSVVAVTGHSLNDTPALKTADLGIALGINGSEVAKNAADMILLDNGFCSIVTGMEQGKDVLKTLKNFSF